MWFLSQDDLLFFLDEEQQSVSDLNFSLVFGGYLVFYSLFVCIRRFHLFKDHSVVLKSTKTCTLWSPDLAQHLLSAPTFFSFQVNIATFCLVQFRPYYCWADKHNLADMVQWKLAPVEYYYPVLKKQVMNISTVCFSLSLYVCWEKIYTIYISPDQITHKHMHTHTTTIKLTSYPTENNGMFVGKPTLNKYSASHVSICVSILKMFCNQNQLNNYRHLCLVLCYLF